MSFSTALTCVFGSHRAISRHSVARSLHSLDVTIGYSPNRANRQSTIRHEIQPPGLPSCISLTPQLQTRMVSMAGIRLRSRESARTFKRIICDDISEIAVGTLITERPPHRTERAPFGHSAPT